MFTKMLPGLNNLKSAEFRLLSNRSPMSTVDYLPSGLQANAKEKSNLNKLIPSITKML